MLQIERLTKAEKLLDEVYDEMLKGYVDEDLMQTAVDIQITVDRMVFHLNHVYYDPPSVKTQNEEAKV